MTPKLHYCFFCDKWLDKKEVNEIDLGDNKFSYHCSTCRKECGEPPQIFKCPNHEEVILKIWGTLEGQNKEKVFFKECPRDKQQEKQPSPEKIGKRALWFIGGGIVFISVLVLIIRYFWKSREEEPQL